MRGPHLRPNSKITKSNAWLAQITKSNFAPGLTERISKFQHTWGGRKEGKRTCFFPPEHGCTDKIRPGFLLFSCDTMAQTYKTLIQKATSIQSLPYSGLSGASKQQQRSAPRGRKAQPNSFVPNLFKILSDTNSEGLLDWDESGTFFKVPKPEAVGTLFKQYYKHDNWVSFGRSKIHHGVDFFVLTAGKFCSATQHIWILEKWQAIRVRDWP